MFLSDTEPVAVALISVDDLRFLRHYRFASIAVHQNPFRGLLPRSFTTLRDFLLSKSFFFCSSFSLLLDPEGFSSMDELCE